MKNTEMLDYLRKAEAAAYDDMMKPRIAEFAYEYHRGKYDAIAHARMDREKWLKNDAKVMNWRLDDLALWLGKVRKWTILPRNRKGIDIILEHLEMLREPIND